MLRYIIEDIFNYFHFHFNSYLMKTYYASAHRTPRSIMTRVYVCFFVIPTTYRFLVRERKKRAIMLVTSRYKRILTIGQSLSSFTRLPLLHEIKWKSPLEATNWISILPKIFFYLLVSFHFARDNRSGNETRKYNNPMDFKWIFEFRLGQAMDRNIRCSNTNRDNSHYPRLIIDRII